MSGLDLPFFGSLLLGAVLVVATYTMTMGVIAGRGRLELTPAVRSGVYTCFGLVALAVFTLAYAFQSHDFHIRYVMRYSDRSMPWYYLIASLWGGQDGSLLWWSFLLTIYSAVCAYSLRNRLPELAPWIMATLMSILAFFCVLMLFAANPFAVVASGTVPDGEGLNPLLQNYWMMIHPPTLYTGMVGWSVPFAFVIAALITGRLENEWVLASRRFTLFAWLALAVGNTLGMLWSYEELGWGGYWAWDPVENAAFMPLLAGTPYLHSVMLQERRGMFRVWNVFLMCLTFMMTIFGTFLTRSGMIASVHSFARSSIGIYFVWYMVLMVAVCAGLIVWRLPLLRSRGRIDSLLSRDFVFLLNNWILMGMLFFVLIATTFPLISEALRGETVTVGPGYYNKWMVPLGLVLMSLTGIGPLLAWRKSTRAQLWRVILVPSAAALVMAVVHVVFGSAAGYPAYVTSDQIYDTATGRALAVVYGCAPVLSMTICTFVVVGHFQEFWRGTRVRMRNAGESFLVALFELITRAKRRYGGYLVHLGLVAMYFGFTGAAYDTDKEAALRPGQSLEVRGFTIRYDGSRMEVDPNRRMVFADMTVLKDGKRVADVAPAKFIYSKPPDTATTEVAIRSTLSEDIYAIMNSVNPQTKLGTFRIIVRPFVAWIWLGGLFMIFGTTVCMSPSVREVLGEVRMPSPRRSAPAMASGLLLLLSTGTIWQLGSSIAHSQGSATSSLHAGSVTMYNDTEKQLFQRLLCMCGGCQRLPLSSCICSEAEEMRAKIRDKLSAGVDPTRIQEDYRSEMGAQAIAIPSDKGLDRALWAVPLSAIAVAAGALVWVGKKWMKPRTAATAHTAGVAPATAEGYDAALDAELRKLDD
ncbi:MAG TPA: cytochrome c-type biogenesis CcmF C-terminal domain-containing protein [Polyangiales bacterium]|nr:cytochrome c-type biogenesis CcmF C-terminal domain-containing protein [Polyangiales bacterium]